MRISECQPGTPVTTKRDSYGSMRVLRVVPKRESKTTYQVIEVEHSSNNDFSFALVKRFRASDLVCVKTEGRQS